MTAGPPEPAGAPRLPVLQPASAPPARPVGAADVPLPLTGAAQRVLAWAVLDVFGRTAPRRPRTRPAAPPPVHIDTLA